MSLRQVRVKYGSIEYSALFHQWGSMIDGDYQVTVAVVEKFNGEIKMVCPEYITFCDNEQWSNNDKRN